nr:CDP-alcohol phosphatidyltransferase family protein [Streptomyces sp. P9(2023)]
MGSGELDTVRPSPGPDGGPRPALRSRRAHPHPWQPPRDGRLARRQATVSPFGDYADSFADAAFWTWLALRHEPSRMPERPRPALPRGRDDAGGCRAPSPATPLTRQPHRTHTCGTDADAHVRTSAALPYPGVRTGAPRRAARHLSDGSISNSVGTGRNLASARHPVGRFTVGPAWEAIRPCCHYLHRQKPCTADSRPTTIFRCQASWGPASSRHCVRRPGGWNGARPAGTSAWSAWREAPGT